jgi:hypothetical protein
VIFTSLQALAQSTQPLNESTINELVSTKIEMDKDGAFNDRFTIHIYQGEIQGANRVKSRYDALDYTYKSELLYEPPNHKVWVGKFRSKLEADRALMQIRKVFPNAKVLKP